MWCSIEWPERPVARAQDTAAGTTSASGPTAEFRSGRTGNASAICRGSDGSVSRVGAARPGSIVERTAAPAAASNRTRRACDVSDQLRNTRSDIGILAVDHLRAALIREIEATIIRFEPRLSNVKVTLHDDADRISRTLQMKVDAVLRADPTPEAISFETLLDPVTRDISVRET